MTTLPLPSTGARRSVPVDTFSLVGTERGLEPAGLRAAPRPWVPAVVPGGVHESLIAAGAIEHPYVDRNERSVRWVEDRDWWYRTVLDLPADLGPDEQLLLVAHGLDTVVDLWLDGEPVAHHENMFRPLELDLTGREPGATELLLRFSPPLAGLEPPQVALDLAARMAAAVGAAFAETPADPADPAAPVAPVDAADAGEAPEPEDPPLAMLPLATRRRKAAFSWGWDFGPRVPSIGIWQPVEVVRRTRAALLGHHVRTDAVDVAARTADVTLRVEVGALVDGLDLEAVVLLTSPAGREHRAVLPVVDGLATGRLHVADAELWWTHDLGEPALHDVRVELWEGGRLLDALDDRVGLRTIVLDRADDPEGGRLFRFVLNGVPMFARGAAWLPASTLVGSVTPARVHELVRLARDGNMTMLRVWGGGIYEQDAFYRATDELGVLVWHDFMFACTDYPSDDPTLRHEVTLEAEHQVRRLRNRASMALWCGNNEVHVLHAVAYQGIEPGGWGWDFFHRILPEAVAQHDGAVPYWPGSPYGEHEAEGFLAVNGVLDGDRHAWEVWHGLELGTSDGPFESVGRSRHYRRYAQDRGKFISEFGIHASPVLSTLERWIPSEALAVHSPSFDAHNKDHPKNKGDALLEIITGLPRTMAEYVDFTMVSQAEGLKFGIEHYRRRQPHCSGALVWQLNDVWPGFSWSVIDHDTVPKAGYHLVRRAFAPVLASLELADDRLSLWVSNSTATDAATTAVLTLAGLDGVTRVEERLPVRVPAGGSQVVWSRVLTAEERGADRYAWVESADGAFPANRLFFAEIKDLPLRRTPVRSTVERTGPTSARVTVTADAFVYLVRCTTPYPTARCSDNYLDLRAGDLRTITVTGLPADFDPADLVVGSYVGV